ncbi:hypothetical protein BKN37_13305 [Mycobacterium talmoniae]|uniref:Uncharacterized protein n=1 Tax=Mycobacterium talmoniae TaxID=1858794 RepID=A0A1S1NKS2_9MYCO|nr:hypothetical protein BKN37_13305 [Mycobacterium talmoniae]
MRWPFLVGILVATVLGCSTTVPGSLVRSTVPPSPADVDVKLLSPGNYPTRPRPPLGAAGDLTTALHFEGMRMADNVVGPWEVDPMLSGRGSAAVQFTPGLLRLAYGPEVADVALAHHVGAAFGTARESASSDKSLDNVVLRFDSTEDAAAAATEMAAKSISFKPPLDEQRLEFQPTPIPRYPDTSAVFTRTDNGDSIVKSYTAHGVYVLFQQANSMDDIGVAVNLIAATLDKQGPLIDQFQPTPVDQLEHLPIDPTGLLARTIPPDKNKLPAGDNGYGELYQARAQLHFAEDPLHTQKVFDAAHLQLVTHGTANVYQTPDAASAQKIVDTLTAETVEQGNGKYAAAAGINGMPDAKCWTYKMMTQTSTYCAAVADRYAIEVSANQEQQARQLVSAQYLMLTSK